MEVLLQKLPNGAMAPIDDEQAEKLRKIKPASWVRCDVKQIRNPGFFRKWWALAKFAYDIWSDTMPTIEWRGQRVQPQFERFRQDLIILAGHYHPVFNIRGEMRVEADSLRWDKMSEEEFEKLFSATIDAVLKKVLTRPDLTPEKVRKYIDGIMRFD